MRLIILNIFRISILTFHLFLLDKKTDIVAHLLLHNALTLNNYGNIDKKIKIVRAIKEFELINLVI